MAPPTRYPHVNGPTLVTIAPEPQLRIPLARSTRQSALAGIVDPGDGDVARAIDARLKLGRIEVLSLHGARPRRDSKR